LSSVLVRGALVTAALIVVGWLALGFRAVDLEAEGEAALERAARGAIPLAEARKAQDALRRARRFSADQGPVLTEGSLLAAVGRRAEAAALARRVIEKEPENDRAWFLAFVTAADRKRAAQARRRVQELNPWAGDALR
jgi:hypothetical protein